MLTQSKDIIEQHIKTHTERSAEDAAAVVTLESFLTSNGAINTLFAKGDKWPNIDGTFEFVPNPSVCRRPAQNFIVQIKGTHVYTETANGIKYQLQSLAFPAFIAADTTLDPGILFVVLNPDERGAKRVFWKYISVDFINSIDFTHGSKTIEFDKSEEIFDTDESVGAFCKKIEHVVQHHSFVNKLSDTLLSRKEIEKIINACNKQITETLDAFDTTELTRDDISQRILPRLYDMCRSALLLNSLKLGSTNANLQLAWEQSLLDAKTKYLSTFLKGIKYLDGRIPDDGQSERLMLKYYNFLWQIRDSLQKEYGMSVLHNLEKFPLKTDILDDQYYELVADAMNSVDLSPRQLGRSRFNVIKRTPFFVGKERYYEVTLQLAGVYATKYNRITAYTKEYIATNYSIQIGYADAAIDLWGVNSNIKIITNWMVSIDPTCLNKLAKILNIHTSISGIYGEYMALMNFLTRSGVNFLELIDLEELSFSQIVDEIYQGSSTSYFKDVLLYLKQYFSKDSEIIGRNTIRYILLNLREETIVNVMYRPQYDKQFPNGLYLATKCYPFEKNPFISNLSGSNTSNEGVIKHIIDIAGDEDLDIVSPYLKIKSKIKETGEIFFETDSIASKEEIEKYNSHLDAWERKQGYKINMENGLVSIDSYEAATINILKTLIEFSKKGNKGQREFNKSYIKNSNILFEDETKLHALENVFVDSHILMIYGAAGTGKTLLINYISNLMSKQKRLFLTKTHTARQNLERRIDNQSNAVFINMDSFTRKVNLPDYDVIFVDECSTIDNRTMEAFLNKIRPDTFLVFAGDIHQIESIDFGNWFFYAKDIINKNGSNVELLNTWRTKEPEIIHLWDEVRHRGELMTEILAVPGHFSDDIGEGIFCETDEDEVILCLNYDGKFGLNNMNSYFQNNNSKGEPVSWQEWIYKSGDSILFNDSQRFSILYNNLKGKIVDIQKDSSKIVFTVDVAINLTEDACKEEEIEFVEAVEGSTRIRFAVYAYDDSSDEGNEALRMRSVIPFQLAYAVSIHKAQGLEYDSVKVIIPKSNAEKITHGIFYTAITRAKKKLKIYWSSEIMDEIVKSFRIEESEQKSLEIIRSKLFKDN